MRIVIAEDAYFVREALAQAFTARDDVDVVRTCDDRDSLLAAVAEEKPDAVVTDIRMPPTHTDEGIQVARVLRETDPDVGVVVLSQYIESSYALGLLETGSAGRAYLLKERSGDYEQLVSAVEAVVAGDSVIDPEVVDTLVQARVRTSPSPLGRLTARELEILAAIAEGKSNAAIARTLFLTKRAVEKHVNSIFHKLELGSSGDISRRVRATLIFLAGRDPTEGPE
jgi:DNA-binding NarL/FixJ family response regulator